MHTRACPRGLNKSTGRVCRTIEYTAHQARVGPSRLLTRVEGNETILNTLLHISTQLPTRSRVVFVPVHATFVLIMYNTNVSRRSPNLRRIQSGIWLSPLAELFLNALCYD